MPAALGCLLSLPINGIQTSTTNWQSFGELAFAFRITPGILLQGLVFAGIMGVHRRAAAGTARGEDGGGGGVEEGVRGARSADMSAGIRDCPGAFGGSGGSMA